MSNVAVGPCHSVSVLLQVSTVVSPLPDEVVGCCRIRVGMPVGVLTIDGSLVNVGDAMDVTVGTGVDVSVGTGVLVGMDAWVSATIVKAAASAVC